MTGIPSDWFRSIVDPDAFADEQWRLEHVWTFVGLISDVVGDGDWFRATLATRPIFVQRFGDQLRAFENACAHRSYPLRTKDRGNGPIRCAFHDWRYNSEGQATGIPMCRELYGKTPREMDMRLNRIELATCGSLIFGRFPLSGDGLSLEDYLGDIYPILAAMCQLPKKVQRTDRSVAANWKVGMHVSLEEYHLPSIHPFTVGLPGHLNPGEVAYEQVGLHNAFLNTPDSGAFRELLAASRAGAHWPGRYAIIHGFPHLMVSQVRTAPGYWYTNIQVYAPIARDRTQLTSWSFVTPVAERRTWWERVLKKLIIRPAFGLYILGFRRTIDEDRAVCEQLQGNVSRFRERPPLGAHEQRIEWFEDALARALAGDPAKCGRGEPIG